MFLNPVVANKNDNWSNNLLVGSVTVKLCAFGGNPVIAVSVTAIDNYNRELKVKSE